ncbi:MAG: ATP-binding cassette domain-containing protein, partial [Bulleidia sp.]
MSEEVVLEAKNLKKYFPAGKGHELHAVDDVSFQIHAGETLGLVGESGCGKTTCARTLIGMYQPTSGQVLYHGKDTAKL